MKNNTTANFIPVVAVSILFILTWTASVHPLRAEQPPLIPRSIILEESERGNPRLSPDGKMIAYSAQYNGVANIWVQTVGKNDNRVLTKDANNGIPYCFWQADGKHVLYFQDQGGDENSHLFQTDIRTGSTRDLTPLAHARAMGLIMEAGHPETLLIHITPETSASLTCTSSISRAGPWNWTRKILGTCPGSTPTTNCA